MNVAEDGKDKMTPLASKARQLLRQFAPAFGPEPPKAIPGPGEVRYADIRAKAHDAREELRRRFSPSA